jgi:hypothetical protein
MAKVLYDTSKNNRVIRNIEDARIYPAEWYVTADFPTWTIVEVSGTLEEVIAGAFVEVIRSEVPDPADQEMYWKDGSTWYRVVIDDFGSVYDAVTGTVVNVATTYPENKTISVTQEYIDELVQFGGVHQHEYHNPIEFNPDEHDHEEHEEPHN